MPKQSSHLRIDTYIKNLALPKFKTEKVNDNLSLIFLEKVL